MKRLLGSLKKVRYFFIIFLLTISAGCGGADTSSGSNKDVDHSDIKISDIKDLGDSTSELGDVCIPNCSNKKCGDDGCGGSCGDCGANALCKGGECACISGYENCDGLWNNGCEVNLSTDNMHCGDCVTSCGENSICDNKVCKCKTGFANCNNLWVDGCEVDLSKPESCGTNCSDITNCGKNSICNSGLCECLPGYGNCDRLWGSGCETDLNTDPNNCGGCGKICGSNALCQSGACVCQTGFADCDKDMSNGCEVDLNSIYSCGTSCTNIVACSSENGFNPVCIGGICKLSCNSGYSDCNQMIGLSDGCETNLNSPSTCGISCSDVVYCGKNSVCVNGKCDCQKNYMNCDGSWDNGCETRVLDDVDNCGECGNRCGANSICDNFKCRCIEGFGNCDNKIENGCETDLNNIESCGTSCYNRVGCSTENGLNPYCDKGVCRLTCNSGYADCNANAGSSDGCETNLNSVNTCGTSCNNVVKCSSNNGTNPYCDNGVCRLTCNSGYADCNANAGSSDGCETNLNSVNTCGTSCNNVVKCSSNNGTNPYCDNGVCRLTCNSGYGDCNAYSGFSDGCETNLLSSVDNCGACGRSCKNEAICSNKACTCENGVCVPYNPCASPEGAACNIDNNPCCEGFSCVTIAQDQKDSKCYKDCTNDQTVCSSTQQCIGWMQGSAACFEVTTIANGTFSNCLSYKDGEEPGQNDKPGSASIKFTLGGISYNFTMCGGDFQIVDQQGNYWMVQIMDLSKLQTKKIAYLYNIIVDEAEHTPGQHEIGEKIQPLVYELLVDSNYNTTKSVLHGFGIDGTLNFTQVGTGGKTPTTGTISNVLMMGYDYVICDNAAGKPCQ